MIQPGEYPTPRDAAWLRDEHGIATVVCLQDEFDLAAKNLVLAELTAAYAEAGLGPKDLSLVHVHDAFAIEELEYYELLGFCPDGEGERLLEAGDTALGGRIPFNTDGGRIARGHPGGPTGLAIVHEVVTQLRGEAGPRQVEGARRALAHLVGGGSVCTVNLFEAD